MLVGAAIGFAACGSDDIAGVNDCDYVPTVSGLKDEYVVGEVTKPISITYTPKNPSASCDAGITKKVLKFASSAPDVVSLTPTYIIVPLTPGRATLSFGVDTRQPYSKTVTVIAAASALRR